MRHSRFCEVIPDLSQAAWTTPALSAPFVVEPGFRFWGYGESPGKPLHASLPRNCLEEPELLTGFSHISSPPSANKGAVASSSHLKANPEQHQPSRVQIPFQGICPVVTPSALLEPFTALPSGPSAQHGLIGGILPILGPLFFTWLLEYSFSSCRFHSLMWFFLVAPISG